MERKHYIAIEIISAIFFIILIYFAHKIFTGIPLGVDYLLICIVVIYLVWLGKKTGQILNMSRINDIIIVTFIGAFACTMIICFFFFNGLISIICLLFALLLIYIFVNYLKSICWEYNGSKAIGDYHACLPAGSQRHLISSPALHLSVSSNLQRTLDPWLSTLLRVPDSR